MKYENNLILVEKPADKVALLTLNNPPLNLVTLELSRELKETLFKLERDDEVRVVVLTGSGEKAFCVGSDVKEFPQVWDDVIGKKLQKENEVFNAIEFLEKPVIAAMEGNVCGGGYEMAMACDLRILSEGGRIAQPEINLGVFPGSGGIFRLPKLVGASKAMEMMFLGEFIDAEDCLRLGLVNRLAPAGKTVNAALDMAEGIAHKPFEAIKLIKKGVREIGMVSSDKCFYKNLEFSRSIFRTEDCKEGVDSWGELIYISAGAVILASGGASQAFEKNLNPGDVSGDGYMLAYESGARLVNMEFMQSGIGFSHPLMNIFNGYIWAAHPLLTNSEGESFLKKYIPDSMSPEYVMDEHRKHFPFSSSDDSKYLEIAIQKEIRAGRGGLHGGIIADLRHMSDDYICQVPDDCGLHHMWPVARSHMKDKGVDLLKQKVEIHVFAHAINGGVCIDAEGSTSLPGLFAAGEVAGGPHGADRLGGNMMVTCQVFGKIAGTFAAQWAGVHRMQTEPPAMYPDDRLWEILHRKADTQGLIHELQSVNQRHLLISRNETGLKQVLNTVERIGRQLADSPRQDTMNMEAFRLYCLMTASRLMGEAALRRQESRGAHYREDYPMVNPRLGRPMFSDQSIC